MKKFFSTLAVLMFFLQAAFANGCMECFFDNKFIEMKKILCLSQEQESALDCIYDRYKKQMQIIHIQAKRERKCLCEELNSKCYDKKVVKEHKRRLKDIEKDAKEQYKCMHKEFEEQLCRDQRKILKRYHKQEKKKLKSIGKHCATTDFPCY